jgi:esterase/lipase superfamily enzyme
MARARGSKYARGARARSEGDQTMTVTVYFATNRAPAAPGPDGVPDFAVDPPNAPQTTYGVAEVEVITQDAERGAITRIRDQKIGGFSAAAAGEIAASGKTVLVFIHGMANSFKDGIKRAAYLQPWFAKSGIAAADATIVAFSWPADKYVISPHLGATIPAWLTRAYKHDQTNAAASADAVAGFVTEIARLLGGRPAGQRLVLLCHSMGNYVLASAAARIVQAIGPRPRPLFDRILLAAPDEIESSFTPGAAQRLGLIGDPLAGGISVYWNRGDVAMYLSFIANQNRRLGERGPDQEHDPARFPPARFDLADCSMVLDYRATLMPDATHQYYRLSRVVRADIAAGIAGVAAGGRVPVGGAVYLLRPF